MKLYLLSYRNVKRTILKKPIFVFVYSLLLFSLIFLIANHSQKTFLSVKLIDINTHDVYKKYERSFSGHENLIFNNDYANFSIEKQKNVNVNSKRHLGSIDTKLFDIQGFILKKEFNMNNLILFPFETDNPYEDDRILAQMSYVPVQVLEVSMLYINYCNMVIYVLS